MAPVLVAGGKWWGSGVCVCMSVREEAVVKGPAVMTARFVILVLCFRGPHHLPCYSIMW